MSTFVELLATGGRVEAQTAAERDLCYRLLQADKVIACPPGHVYRLKSEPLRRARRVRRAA